MTAELELRGITKRFPGVLANDHIDLVVETGEIHAVVGENGAGKTTLMSILFGLIPPDEGSIWIRGNLMRFASPTDAIRAGLGMVHQSFRLFPSLSVAENVVFGAEPARGPRFERRRAVAEVERLADRFGLHVDPRARVETLPVGVLQRVEILKALYREARVLILDEPTAVLTPQEREQLFGILRRLREEGRTIVFITHKLNEVMELSDRVTVLRRGRVVAVARTADTTPQQISYEMTGRAVRDIRSPARPPRPDVALAVEGLTVTGPGDQPVVDNVSFEVHREEIVAIAGVAGNGQSELIAAVAGLRPLDAGRVMIGELDATRAPVRGRREAGLSYVPEDRHGVGTADAGTVLENTVMGHHRAFVERGVLDRRRMYGFTDDVIREFEVAVSSPDVAVGTLSGGNLQKLVVGREMSHRTAAVLVAEQPTRGVDVGSIEAIHQRIIDFRDQGGGVLLVTAELWEARALAGRILVMFDGRIVAEFSPDTDERRIGLAMTGAGDA